MPIQDWSRVEDNVFHDFHGLWIYHIRHALNNGVLPGEYFASADDTVVGFRPDVVTLETSSAKGSNGKSDSHFEAGGVAVAKAPPRVRFEALALPRATLPNRKRLLIRNGEFGNVVAVIEIVSRGNKASRSELNRFTTKCGMFLDARIHLLILDLHSPTRRDPNGIHGAIWSTISGEKYTAPAGQPLTAVAYVADDPIRAFIEPLAVGLPIPDMPLFLDPEWYVNVPLERTYNLAFAEVPRVRRDLLE